MSDQPGDSRVSHPFQFMHRGEDGCGRPIAFMRRMPEVGEFVQSADGLHLDGSAIDHGEMMRCGSCGLVVRYRTAPPLAFIEPRP